VPLANDSEDHPPDEAYGEEGEQFAKLALLNLGEDGGAQCDIGLVFPEAEAQEVVGAILLEGFKVLRVVRKIDQELFLIDLERGVFVRRCFFAEHGVLLLGVAGVFGALDCLFLDVAVKVMKFVVFFGECGEDLAEVVPQAGVQAVGLLLEVFQYILGEEHAVEYLNLRVGCLESGRLWFGVAVREEDPFDEVVEGEPEVLLVDELLVDSRHQLQEALVALFLVGLLQVVVNAPVALPFLLLLLRQGRGRVSGKLLIEFSEGGCHVCWQFAADDVEGFLRLSAEDVFEGFDVVILKELLDLFCEILLHVIIIGRYRATIGAFYNKLQLL
jgi:hypothetical protein